MYSKHIVGGYLGGDPEMRFTPEGKAVCNFSVAVNSRDKEGTERTSWIRVTVWDKQAETCNQYLKKGSRVLTEGSNIRASAYMDKQSGEPRASLELTASRVVFCGEAGNANGNTASEEEEEANIPF